MRNANGFLTVVELIVALLRVVVVLVTGAGIALTGVAGGFVLVHFISKFW